MSRVRTSRRPPRQRYEKCPKNNKRTFPDNVSALLFMSKIQRISIEREVPRRAYKCEACPGWHLTHKEDRYA